MDLKRATIRRFDPASWTADIELPGAPGGLLTGVAVNACLAPGLLPAGTPVWACLSPDGNPALAAVLAPVGSPPTPWLTSRLWRPSLALAQAAAPVACTSTVLVQVAGLSATLTFEVAGAALLLLAASGQLSAPGLVYQLALYHDDVHETTQLAPVAALTSERWALGWPLLAAAVDPGTHTFAVRHCISAGQATVDAATLVALAMAT